MRTEFDLSSKVRKIDIDNRISLKYYYRIAHSLVRQANIYRGENNLIELYVVLMRLSSLITETIPLHRDYHILLQDEKLSFGKRILKYIDELEKIKPEVRQQIDKLNNKSRNQISRFGQNSFNNPLEWPSNRSLGTRTDNRQSYPMPEFEGFSSRPVSQYYKLAQNKPSEGQFGRISLNFPRPKEETLSRHSILGPNGLHGRWQQPIPTRAIQYPINLDSTPVDIPSLLQSTKDEPKPAAVKDNSSSEHEKSHAEEVLSLHDGRASMPTKEQSIESHMEEVLSLHDGRSSIMATKEQSIESNSLINLDIAESPPVEIIRQPSPPPVHAEVQDIVSTELSLSAASQTTFQDEQLRSESPLEVHISTTLMDSFLRVAKSNTDRSLETCGVLAGSLKNRKFFVTALIIPKQESTSDTCQTVNEEEIFDYQDKQSLFTLGWIHTHPTQSCFMSSVDVHTHYSYQIMLPEAIAIVMAPKDSSRKHGIFRLTAPGGMSVIRQCQQRGFHSHPAPVGGGPIYDHCADVYMNPKVKYDVVDLR